MFDYLEKTRLPPSVSGLVSYFSLYGVTVEKLERRSCSHCVLLLSVVNQNLNVLTYRVIQSLSGISDLCGRVTGMVMPKGSMSTEGEILQFSVLPYRCSICPPLVTRQMSNLAILAMSNLAILADVKFGNFGRF